MNEIQGIGPVQGGALQPQPSKIQPNRTDVPSFAEMLQGFLKDVNQMQLRADESVKKLVAGEINDVHQVMSAAQEANVAFNMMMEIRNKVMEAYQEVMRLRI